MQFKLRVVGHVDEVITSRGSDLSEDQTFSLGTESVLDVLIKDITKPLAPHSQILGETIFLCPDKQLAGQLETEGKVVYLPEEIAALLNALKTKDQGECGIFLKSVHTAKKTFIGSRIQP